MVSNKMGNCRNCATLLLVVFVLAYSLYCLTSASIAAAVVPSTLSLSLSLLLNFFGWFAGESGGLEFDVKIRLISFAWYAENKKITTTMHPAIYGWHFGQHGFLVSKKHRKEQNYKQNIRNFWNTKFEEKNRFWHTHTHLI